MNAVESMRFESQLDELKIVTLTDGEVWSARDLMPFAGYTNWRKWSGAIDRAIESVNASGLNAADHFVGGVKMIETGKGARREVEDVEVTRYGAYILFQNGDPRKPEIAAAQSYFAVQTRKQEVTPAAFDPTSLDGAMQLVQAAQTALQALAVAKPKADAWDDLASGDGTYSVGDAAKMLQQAGIKTGRDRLFRHMYDMGWVYRQSSRWQAKQSAVDTGRLFHKPQSHRHPETGETVLDAPQVRVTMKGLEKLRLLMLPPMSELGEVAA